MSEIDNNNTNNYATIKGEPVTALPKDLYIPPEALKVFLEAFEGPLDLLLYMIKKQNLDVLDIPIAEITKQYMEYVEIMKDVHLELAAEYMVMAVMLAEIKSRMLLPKPVADESEDDPRAELVRRLQEYERFKQAAEDLDKMPRINRDIFLAGAEMPDIEIKKPLPEVDIQDLCFALKDILQRAEMYEHHQIEREILSTRARMVQILVDLPADKFVNFEALFTLEEGRAGVIVTFTAVLELIRQTVIEMVQAEAFGQIHIKKIGE
ncbi:MAG: segregation/condensation protein A [Gammaproteobacteria bacterium]|nr:segregation/condensation protein A [Gammaproteobacteria bacterium]